MADLGNSKIKDTYQLVLQTDSSGNLQKLDGTTPNPFIVNGNLRYVDGNQADGYVLKSDASGNASWAAAAGTSYWSANTDGSISPSGLTPSIGIGTTTPNSTLTVVGGVSATTFLSTNVINATTIAGSEFNSTSDTGYKINTNKTLWVDGGDTQVGNASLDTDILGSTINLHAPTSGGSLTLKETLGVSGRTFLGTIDAAGASYSNDKILVAQSNGEVEYLTTAELKADIGDNDYWTGNTDGTSISPSGTSTDIRVSGNTYTNNLVLKANAGGTDYGQITPDVNHGTIKFMTKPPGTADNGESLTIAQDLIEAKAAPGTGLPVSYMKLQPVDGGQDIISFNDANNDIDFIIKSDNQIAFKLVAANDMMAFRDYVGIGYSADKWPTDTGGIGGTPKYQLRVAGQTLLSGITTPLEVIGNISGTTDLYLGSSTHTASTITAENKLTIKGHGSTNDYLTLENDYVQVFIDGASALWIANTPGDGQMILNASSKDMNTKIMTDDNIAGVFVDAGLNLVRLRNNVIITSDDSITPTDYNNALYVSGSSLFYSGGTSLTNTNAISAVGHISGTTDLYLDNDLRVSGTVYTNTITTTGATTDTLVIKSNQVDIKSDGGDVEFVSVRDDKLNFYLDNTEAVTFSKTNSYYYFNTGGQNYDFRIDGPTADNSLEVDVSANRTRLVHHLAIGRAANLPSSLVDTYGLAVTGSSLLYSGTSNTNALVLQGNLSGTTDGRFGGNFGVSGRTFLGTVDAVSGPTPTSSEQILVLQSTGEVETITKAQLTGFTENYWSSNTYDSSISPSGSNVTTNVRISGDTHIKGNLGVSGNTYITGLLNTDSSSGFQLGGVSTLWVDSGDVQVGNTAKDTDIIGASINLNKYTTISNQSGDGDSVPLTVKGAEGQAASFFVIEDAEGTDILTLTRSQTLSAAGNLGVSGNTYTTGAFVVGNATLTTSELDISSGDFTLDVEGDITLDANGADILLSDNGTDFGRFKRDSSDFIIKSEGNNNDIVFRGQDAGVTRDALLLDMSDAGTATFNNGVNISGVTSGRTDASFGGNLGVSGRTFLGSVDAVTPTPTSSDKLLVLQSTGEVESITKAQLTGLTQDQYSYQYITFLGNTGALSDDNWQIVGTNGISNHTWGTDAGADGITTGSSTISLARTSQHSGIRVPAGAILVGVEGTVRSNTNDDAYYGIFTYLPDYEGPDASTATLRILAQTPTSSNNVTNDPQSLKQYAGPADEHVFADGEMIMPGFRRGSTSSQTLIGSWTIILKTLITT